MQVPLFNQSTSYVNRVIKFVDTQGFSKYLSQRIVNFLVKYDANYYYEQQSKYTENPDLYLQEDDSAYISAMESLDKALPLRLVVKTVIKFIAHKSFILVNLLSRMFSNKYFSTFIIRKSYVEDVEALFDNNDRAIVRLIYPFPLSFTRQFRYVNYLRRNNIDFLLDGFDYSLRDLLIFVFHRDIISFIRLESRAQLRTAVRHKSIFDLKTIQCSDEYDFGSIFYSRFMARYGIMVHNSAHGVGKYLPYQRYHSFSLLTSAQKKFYEGYNKSIEFSIREMKINAQKRIPVHGLCFVFLGQYSKSAPSLIKDDELFILETLASISEKYPEVSFMYKKHPNNTEYDPSQYKGLTLLDCVPVSSDGSKLYQFSFYSTCYIDPNFEGHKFLVQTKLIRPQIVFGTSVDIVDIRMLEDRIVSLITEKSC